MATGLVVSYATLITHLLVCMFSMSSWLTVSGLWVEVPVFLQTLPEGISLPSYLVLMVQLANVGPICYGLIKKYLISEHTRKSLRFECWSVGFLLALGLVTCLLLTLFWNRVSIINGSQHSVALFSLTTIMAIVDCTSSVIFLPFMARFPSEFMTSFYIGEGLSGLVPGIAGIVQGHATKSGNNTTTNLPLNESYTLADDRISGLNFSLEVFFIFLAIIVCFSAISFTCLNLVPMCKELQKIPYDCLDSKCLLRSETIMSEFDYNYHLLDDDSLISSDLNVEIESPPLNKSNQLAFLLVITMWINCLGNGLLPSLQSFACLPYGTSAYSLAVKLSVVINPLSPLLGLRFRCRSKVAVTILTTLVSVLAIYVIIIAHQSPKPLLANTTAGAVLIVGSLILISCISSFIKVTIASTLSEIGGYKALFWCGSLTQVGSFIGAVISYCLINIAGVFHS